MKQYITELAKKMETRFMSKDEASDWWILLPNGVSASGVKHGHRVIYIDKDETFPWSNEEIGEEGNEVAALHELGHQFHEHNHAPLDWIEKVRREQDATTWALDNLIGDPTVGQMAFLMAAYWTYLDAAQLAGYSLDELP